MRNDSFLYFISDQNMDRLQILIVTWALLHASFTNSYVLTKNSFSQEIDPDSDGGKMSAFRKYFSRFTVPGANFGEMICNGRSRFAPCGCKGN